MISGRRLENEVGDEPEEQRDHYRELLEELRTVLPGVQVLFAFLLTAAFSGRFTELDDLGRRAYAIALLGVAVASVTMMAPAAFHRMSDPDKRALRVVVSIRLQMVGMAVLLASMSLALFVVARFIFDDTLIGVAFGATTLLVGVALWYALPRAKRLNRFG